MADKQESLNCKELNICHLCFRPWQNTWYKSYPFYDIANCYKNHAILLICNLCTDFTRLDWTGSQQEGGKKYVQVSFMKEERKKEKKVKENFATNSIKKINK